MLIDFAITNFRSIKERQLYSLQPIGKVKELPENICTGSEFQLLKSMIIYGRNGSGKSNLLKAFKALHYLLEKSATFKTGDEIPAYEPFLLDIDTAKKPVEFEINFYAQDGLRYNYYISYDQNTVLRENLFYYPGRKKAKLFSRDRNESIEVSETIESSYKKVEEGLYPNQLFLSKVGTEKINALIPPYSFLKNQLSTHVAHHTHYDDTLINTFIKIMRESKNDVVIAGVNKLLSVADIGIKGIRVKENKEEDFRFPDTIDKEVRNKIFQNLQYQIRTKHNLYKDGEKVDEIEFSIEEESTGTKKLLAFGSVIIEALREGRVLVIDELDKSLHPVLTRALIKVFNNQKTNPNNAQLIFASHDVSLLTNEIFRRDQITFCDKSNAGASNYYSLGAIKGVRKEISYEKYYLKGTFGGTPVINEYELDFNITNNND